MRGTGSPSPLLAAPLATGSTASKPGIHTYTHAHTHTHTHTHTQLPYTHIHTHTQKNTFLIGPFLLGPRASNGESRWLAGSCRRGVGDFFSAGARWSDRSRRRGCERRTRSTDLQQEIEGDKVRERVGQREKERRRGNSPVVRRRRRGLNSVTPLQLAASLLLRGHS